MIECEKVLKDLSLIILKGERETRYEIPGLSRLSQEEKGSLIDNLAGDFLPHRYSHGRIIYKVNELSDIARAFFQGSTTYRSFYSWFEIEYEDTVIRIDLTG